MSVSALLAWAAAGGTVLDPIAIQVGADGNRSVFARRAIADGEVLLAVPRRLIVGDAEVGASSVGRAMESFATMLHSRYMSIAAWVALERNAHSTSWAPYVDALPTSFHRWTPSRIAALDGTRAGELLEKRSRWFAEDCALLMDLVSPQVPLAPDDLEWGLAVARSRCFAVAPVGAQALVPLADMLDHTARADAAWTYCPDAERFEMRAKRSLADGEPIRHTYGTYDNARWLAAYGFVLENNPDDEVSLRFNADEPAIHVGTHFDERFRRAIQAARAMSESDDPRMTLDALREAARRADERISSEEVEHVDDPGWARTCATVRAGERAVLAEIASFTTRASSAIEATPKERHSLAETISADAVGADRLLRGFLLACEGSSYFSIGVTATASD